MSITSKRAAMALYTHTYSAADDTVDDLNEWAESVAGGPTWNGSPYFQLGDQDGNHWGQVCAFDGLGGYNPVDDGAVLIGSGGAQAFNTMTAADFAAVYVVIGG